MKPIQRNIGLEGYFTLKVIRPDGTVRKSLTFKNLILNAGLNRMGTGDIVNAVQVGSGSTAPVVTDTALQSYVAGTYTLRGNEYGYQSSTPYFGWTRVTYRFAEGDAAGNLSEVGVGWDISGSLFSRALIVDSLGAPTTITVLSDEVLDVTYELRLYPPLTDATFDITISGVTYACVLRPGLVNSSAWEPRNIFSHGATYEYSLFCWTGDLGTMFESPSGTNFGYVGSTYEPYSNNSLKRRFNVKWDLDAGNHADKIKSMSMWQDYPSLGNWQVSFTPVIPKDETKELNLPFEISWARKTI